jgi:hypothetical protein
VTRQATAQKEHSPVPKKVDGKGYYYRQPELSCSLVAQSRQETEQTVPGETGPGSPKVARLPSGHIPDSLHNTKSKVAEKYIGTQKQSRTGLGKFFKEGSQGDNPPTPRLIQHKTV